MKKHQPSQFIAQDLKHIHDDELIPAIQKHVTYLLDQALLLSQADQREDESSIHSIRVALKKLRSYWRLIRFAVDDAEFKAADVRIRTTAKRLAGQRDQQVLCDSLQTLKSQLKAPEKSTIETLIGQINQTSEITSSMTINWSEVIIALQLERSKWQDLIHTPRQSHLIQEALQSTFNRSCRCAQEAIQNTATSTQRHQWRKWVKYLYYQLKLLKQLEVKRNKEHKKILKRLSSLGESLGYEHDFEILRIYLEQQLQAHPDLQASLKKIIKVNQKRLQHLRIHANRLDKSLLK